MKTTETIQRSITKLENDALIAIDPRVRKKMAKELQFLKDCRNYLEHNPGEEFLKQQLATLEAKCDKLRENYGTWLNSTPGAKSLKNPLSAFETAVDIKQYKAQIETLKFLLT